MTSTATTLGTGTPTTQSFVYNANGELTSGGRTYDALGRLTGKANPAGSGQVTYTYNPSGQRTMMSRTGANAGTQKMVWDTNNALPLITQTENTGDTLGAGLGEQSHLWTPAGLPLATYQASSSPLWYTHDALGSVTDITTDTGTAVTSMRYTLFGEQTVTDNQTTPSAEPIAPGFGYAGGFNHLADPEIHLRARDYDPALSRFTAPDPLSPDNGAAALTTYHYAYHSPLLYIDPSGKWPDWIDDAASRILDKLTSFGEVTPTQAMTDFSAGVIGSAAALGDLAYNCAQRVAGPACQDYLNGGGTTPGKHVSGWINDRVSANSDNIYYFCGELVGLPGLGSLGKVSTLGRMGNRGVGAATTGPSKALRPVGSVLESVDDVIANPQLLAGKHPAQVESILRGTPGWEVGTLGRGRSAGAGWTFRQRNARGTDYTDLYIQWSPGSSRHFGGAPYWKVSSGTHGTQWIQQ